MNDARPACRIETITRIPADRLMSVVQDYINCGAEVRAEHKNDGHGLRVIARFRLDAHYPASGEPVFAV
jgi:hypothetical protein